MNEGAHFVIVGAGQAGGRAAEAMRKAGFAGRITLIGEEPEAPYERPPLSKAVLKGEKPASSTRLLPAEFDAQNGVELITGTHVTSIDALARRITTSGGQEYAYSKLLLTTGGRVRTLPFAPVGRPGVFYLRTVTDALALGSALKSAKRFVVIGGGFLGLEAAASARELGCEVTVLELKPHLLDRAMAPAIAQHVEAMHRAKGVEIKLGVQVSDIVGERNVEAVALADGTRAPADLVLVSVGIIPNTDLATQAGADADNGIIVNEYGETSVNGIYAAGDVANHFSPALGRRVRLESWQCAQNQAIAVAHNMCGEKAPYSEVPWFWSDQFKTNVQMIGAPLVTEKVILRGEPASGRFMCFNLAGGVVVGATAFNMGGEIRFARKMIEAKAVLDPATLADSTKKLKDLTAPLGV